MVAENDELEVMEPEFYRMGYIRHFRAYGVEFKEGPMGVGVYAAKDIPTLNKARVCVQLFWISSLYVIESFFFS